MPVNDVTLTIGMAVMATREIDIRGQVCPSSLLSALKEMNSCRDAIKRGDITLAFLTDNRNATVTIPDSATAMGYRAVVTTERDYYRVTVSAKQAAAP